MYQKVSSCGPFMVNIPKVIAASSMVSIKITTKLAGTTDWLGWRKWSGLRAENPKKSAAELMNTYSRKGNSRTRKRFPPTKDIGRQIVAHRPLNRKMIPKYPAR